MLILPIQLRQSAKSNPLTGTILNIKFIHLKLYWYIHFLTSQDIHISCNLCTCSQQITSVSVPSFKAMENILPFNKCSGFTKKENKCYRSTFICVFFFCFFFKHRSNISQHFIASADINFHLFSHRSYISANFLSPIISLIQSKTLNTFQYFYLIYAYEIFC